jgi:hypothetical protein
MKRTEVQIALAVIAFQEDEGYETFKEVFYEGGTADIVSTRGPDTIVTEAKLSRSIAVITQATRWKGHANQIYVAVPKRKQGDSYEWDRALHLAGIGEFTVDDEGEVVRARSPLRWRVDGLGIRAVLKIQHKDFADAGNATGSRYSPFQEIARDLRAAVEANQGISLIEFTGDAFKAESLRRSIKRGAIKGLVVRSGKVFQEGFDRHKFKQ